MNLLRQWFVKHHGEGVDYQFDLYRCDKCHRVVTHRMIARGGCGCSKSRLSPTNPTAMEFVKLMVAPWLTR